MDAILEAPVLMYAIAVTRHEEEWKPRISFTLLTTKSPRRTVSGVVSQFRHGAQEKVVD